VIVSELGAVLVEREVELGFGYYFEAGDEVLLELAWLSATGAVGGLHGG
jgi:hypothetical protein